MSLFDIIILALVQGLTEFLPISSSGHLVLIPYLLGMDDPSLGVSAALHFGTLLAVLAYFWRDWIGIVFRGLGIKSPIRTREEYPKHLLWLLALATVPAAAFGYVFRDAVEFLDMFPLIVALGTCIGGIILLLADKFGKKRLAVRSINVRQTVIFGLAQVLALFSGVSRSGITMSAGLFLGFTRKDAARFSFFMAAPIIFGAAVLEFPNLLCVEQLNLVVIGVFISFISALVVIRFMMRFIERVTYVVFVWYSFFLAVLVGVVGVMNFV